MALLLLGLGWNVGPASAELFNATLTGTVSTGTLNGVSIDGSAFVLNATIASEVDLNPLAILGIFQVSEAVMHIGATEQFVFDPNKVFFVQQLEVGNFAVGFVDDPTVPPTASQIAYQDYPPTAPSFDPNVLLPYSHNSFQYQWAQGSFINGGATLTLSGLGLSGAAVQVSAVPEPSSLFLFGMAGLSGLSLITLRRGLRRKA